MKYGAGLDVCVGMFRKDGTWADFDKEFFLVGPKLQHFQYIDTRKEGALLLKDWHIRIYDKVYSFKAGFDYDGSSIPRIFWATIGHPYLMCYLLQATWHDGMYITHLVKQKEADDTFLDLLACFGDNGWYKRNKMWIAVRAGGQIVYPKTDKEIFYYRNYVIRTDLSKTNNHCCDLSLIGTGERISAVPEMSHIILAA